MLVKNTYCNTTVQKHSHCGTECLGGGMDRLKKELEWEKRYYDRGTTTKINTRVNEQKGYAVMVIDEIDFFYHKPLHKIITFVVE